MEQAGGSASTTTGIAQVMLAAGLWGTVGVSTKLVTSAGMVPQEMLSLARLAIGGPALLLLVLVIARSSLSAVFALDPARLVAFVLGCTVFQLCLFQAFVLLEVTTTVFITVCLPPLIGTAVSLAKADRTVTPGGLFALGLGTLGLAAFTIDGFSAGFDRAFVGPCPCRTSRSGIRPDDLGRPPSQPDKQPDACGGDGPDPVGPSHVPAAVIQQL